MNHTFLFPSPLTGTRDTRPHLLRQHQIPLNKSKTSRAWLLRVKTAHALPCQMFISGHGSKPISGFRCTTHFRTYSGWIKSEVHWGPTGILGFDPWPYICCRYGTPKEGGFPLQPPKQGYPHQETHPHKFVWQRTATRLRCWHPRGGRGALGEEFGAGGHRYGAVPVPGPPARAGGRGAQAKPGTGGESKGGVGGVGGGGNLFAQVLRAGLFFEDSLAVLGRMRVRIWLVFESLVGFSHGFSTLVRLFLADCPSRWRMLLPSCSW